MRTPNFILTAFTIILVCANSWASDVSMVTKKGKTWSFVKTVEITQDGINLISDDKEFNCTIENDFIKAMNTSSLAVAYDLKHHNYDVLCDYVGFSHLYAKKLTPLD